MVSILASCVRGPEFDPRRWRGKFVGRSEHASLRVICRNDMIQCAVLRIGTLTGYPLCRDSHPPCRLKISTQVLCILMHVCSSCKHTGAYKCTPPKNSQKLIDGSNKKTKQKLEMRVCKTLCPQLCACP